jgi:hypothetical protein
LRVFVGSFASELERSERRHWCGKYLEGLLQEGERKSIEPLCPDRPLTLLSAPDRLFKRPIKASHVNNRVHFNRLPD